MITSVDWKKQIKDFIESLNQEKNKATVISSYKLTKEELNEIKKSFLFLKEADVLENVIDSKILGGLVIKFKNKVVDLSIAGQLKNFKKLLL